MKRLFQWSDFKFPSTLRISPYVKTLLEPVDCVETFNRLELGLHEALVNSVVHGNLSDPSKNLRVRRVLTPNWFIWQIQDEGEGLDVKRRKGVLPSKVDANNGRGLYLIYYCFDDVRWSRKGNRLQLSARKMKVVNDFHPSFMSVQTIKISCTN